MTRDPSDGSVVPFVKPAKRVAREAIAAMREMLKKPPKGAA